MAYDDTKGFLFSFKNKTSDLVNVSGTSWKAQVQSDFLQFTYYGGTSNTWVVINKNGSFNKYFFGSSSASRMANPKSGWSSSGDSNTWHWALDTIITATGDKTTITYTSAGGRLDPHVYSYNGSTGGSGITPLVCRYVQFDNDEPPRHHDFVPFRGPGYQSVRIEFHRPYREQPNGVEQLSQGQLFALNWTGTALLNNTLWR